MDAQRSRQRTAEGSPEAARQAGNDGNTTRCRHSLCNSAKTFLSEVTSDTFSYCPYHTLSYTLSILIIPFIFSSAQKSRSLERWRVNWRLGTASFTFSTSTTPLRPRAKALAYNQITSFNKRFADVLTGF